MVADTVLVALASGGAAVAAAGLTGFINRQNTKDQIEAQQMQLESRLQADKESRQAEFYVDHKVESLTELHAILVNCRSRIGDQLAEGGPFISEQEFHAEIEPIVNGLIMASDKALIFLESDQSDAISDAVMKVIEAEEYIETAIKGGDGPPNEGIEEFINETEKAKDVLSKEINEPIQRFESS